MLAALENRFVAHASRYARLLPHGAATDVALASHFFALSLESIFFSLSFSVHTSFILRRLLPSFSAFISSMYNFFFLASQGLAMFRGIPPTPPPVCRHGPGAFSRRLNVPCLF